MNTQNFIQKALDAIKQFLWFIQPEAVEILHTSNDVANALKLLDQGETVQSIAAKFIPFELQGAFMLWLPVAVKAMNWAATGNDEQLISDAVKYLLSLDGDHRAVQFTSLAALIASWLALNTNGVTLPIQQAIVAVPVVYDAKVVEGA